ncbi:MAG: alpha/beta hydrolase [Acidimicrobiales bacterium]|nr:alpha/beta hydrolase [Acidimicrobiales bacterium]
MPVRSYLGGAVLADRNDGEGPPLLCVHGWGRSRRDMAGVAAGRDSLVPDLPGFGSSPPPTEVWGPAQYAELIAKVADADGGGPFIVVGHSFGGRVAARLGAHRPDLVMGIVEVGAPLLRAEPARPPSLGYRAVRWANRVGLWSDRRMERIRQRRGSADYLAATGIMRNVLVRTVAEEDTDELRELSCPVAFCWGEDDSAARPVVAERAARLVAHVAGYEVVPGAGHDVHLSHPEAVRRGIASIEKALPCQ